MSRWNLLITEHYELLLKVNEMGLLDRINANLEGQIEAETSAERAREERKAAALEKKKQLFAQPGYFWTIYFNNNAPYTQSQGWYLASCKLTETVNGAAPLPEGFNNRLTAWAYKAEQLFSRNTSSFQVQVFTPESEFQDEESIPFFEIDLIIREGGVNGRLCVNEAGEETVIGRGMPVPPGYNTVKEIALRFQVEPFLVPGSEKFWNPQANNPFAGLAKDKVSELVNKSAALFRRKQDAGLNAWRADRDAGRALEANPNVQEASKSLETTDATPARKTRASKIV